MNFHSGRGTKEKRDTPVRPSRSVWFQRTQIRQNSTDPFGRKPMESVCARGGEAGKAVGPIVWRLSSEPDGFVSGFPLVELVGVSVPLLMRKHLHTGDSSLLVSV